ncbi:MAG: hypothetical protein HYW26_05740 [Candidatus Aenigmarchaeota archaeon]|nr:hypothetical protein [Candidatus Aenigmarchaeota archaeon]
MIELRRRFGAFLTRFSTEEFYALARAHQDESGLSSFIASRDGIPALFYVKEGRVYVLTRGDSLPGVLETAEKDLETYEKDLGA